jgi:signal transduction histidine kinase
VASPDGASHSALRPLLNVRAARLLPPSIPAIVALAAVYYGAAHVGYALEIAGPVAAIVWLPAGVGIAFLSLGGPQLWPGVLIGDLLVNDYMALPLGTALMQTAGNLLEAVVAALLIRRVIARRGPPLASVGALGRTLLAIAAGVGASATVGVSAQLLGGVIAAGAADSVWRTWWLGDAAGAVILVPVALAWATPPSRAWLTRRLPEAVALLVVAGVVAELVFRSHQPLTYLTFPALIWAALRFREWGVTVVIAVLAAVSTWNTAHLIGPFVFHSVPHSVVGEQLFIIVPAVVTLALAAVVAEREAFAAGLGASRTRLVDAADGERRRIERNLHDGAQQRLTALGVQLGEVREQLTAVEPARAEVALQRAQAQLWLAVDELRELAQGIHPTVLTERGLAGAVESIAARSPVLIEVGELPRGRFEPTVEATAYYVVAEAVANAHKHADATAIRIAGRVVDGSLHLEIVDDGGGGAVEVHGAGLEGLHDRVEAVGGKLDVISVGGRGTRVSVRLPTRGHDS